MNKTFLLSIALVGALLIGVVGMNKFAPDKAFEGEWIRDDGSETIYILPSHTVKATESNGNPGADGTWKAESPSLAQMTLNMSILGTQNVTVEAKDGVLYLYTDPSDKLMYKRCDTNCTPLT